MQGIINTNYHRLMVGPRNAPLPRGYILDEKSSANSTLAAFLVCHSPTSPHFDLKSGKVGALIACSRAETFRRVD